MQCLVQELLPWEPIRSARAHAAMTYRMERAERRAREEAERLREASEATRDAPSKWEPNPPAVSHCHFFFYFNSVVVIEYSIHLKLAIDTQTVSVFSGRYGFPDLGGGRGAGLHGIRLTDGWHVVTLADARRRLILLNANFCH